MLRVHRLIIHDRKSVFISQLQGGTFSHFTAFCSRLHMSEFIVWISKYLILTKTLKKHSYFLLQNPWKVLLSVWGSGDRAEKTEGFAPRPGVSVHWPRIHWPRLWRPKSAIAIFFYQEIWAIQCVVVLVPTDNKRRFTGLHLRPVNVWWIYIICGPWCKMSLTSLLKQFLYFNLYLIILYCNLYDYFSLF